MRKPREDSKCFAVLSLRKILASSHDKNAYPGGTVKDFVVEKHLDVFVSNGNLKRNFTFWWRHTKPDGSIVYKRVGLQRKKSQRGMGRVGQVAFREKQCDDRTACMYGQMRQADD
jgi:hypothetical protein